ncbi:YbhB/YbcL family Raf kinase inhibitor-like protein [Lysinimonas soli]|uniref:YbhB/YbcL family Raf kinase inhibitor-like protein n=1 Tax=Lysinimonas soli TaxID=1074233 RepID=A0ABW0NTQ6_9MICO
MSYNPYQNAIPTGTFELTSPDFASGGALPSTAWGSETTAGDSPALTWASLPENARGVLVTVFDADAPVPGGFWHWAVVVPADGGGLAAGAGTPDGSRLPGGSTALSNSFGVAGYVGAQPPAGTGTHRYFVAATALDVASLDLPAETSLAMLHAAIIPHTLGRAVIVGTAAAAE